MSAQLVGKENIEALIPHAAEMVLLDAVQQWDDTSIECRTGTHRNPDNPLRVGGGLSVYAGLEYAAQVMALHARLRAENGSGKPRQGLVVVASKIVTHVEWLHKLDDDLIVLVNLQDDAGDSSLYDFSVTANGCILLSGRLLVVLMQD